MAIDTLWEKGGISHSAHLMSFKDIHVISESETNRHASWSHMGIFWVALKLPTLLQTLSEVRLS